ncbi:hypothetical protein AV521_32410 [Streptomyces sp. IMTB 2501]|uniref:AbrB family transcriptional regulator n=1 Tax=Streptomyces sp. IMTB 2501 TaxID=1776340 RepID=UPI00096EFBA2|nr:AbrB family transcriptional regulator [Streptomyces sp. IMTB 2501]OLZ65380.1 hypothetical protein AV521_32410 [Streptomyces sp. IMTB 2501]
MRAVGGSVGGFLPVGSVQVHAHWCGFEWTRPRLPRLLRDHSGLLAWAVTAFTHITLGNLHLVTTPGGIDAAPATASASNANVTLVFAVQALCLFLMVLAAPALIRWILHRRSTARPGAGPMPPRAEDT